MNANLVPAMLASALTNGLATLVLFMAYIRLRRWALLLIPAVPILSAVAIIGLSNATDSRFSFLGTV